MQQLSAATAARTRRPVTVLQFGSGNFLRGFVDWMIQQTNDAGLTDHGVAIVYATHRPDRHDPLADQDGLYHVVLDGVRDGVQQRRVDRVDVVQQLIDPYADYAALRAVAVSPHLRVIVSNTTEAGIVDVPDDLSAQPATSFPGQVAQVLHERWSTLDGDPAAGLEIVCCELIEHNGERLRTIVLAQAERAGWEPEFAAWVRNHCRFYDTLVDRIVSGFPADEADALATELGVEDRALVKGELFSLWVIGGPEELRHVLPFDQLPLGVQFVAPADVDLIRDKKVRVLNGCHTTLAATGLQCGFHTVDEAFADPVEHALLQRLLDTEIIPTIPDPAADVRAFADRIVERFANPALHHRLADISLNAGSKYLARNLPVLLDRWAAGCEAPLSSVALAAILTLYHDGAADFEPRDAEPLLKAAARPLDDPVVWVQGCLDALGVGAEPYSDRLRHQVAAQVTAMRSRGMHATLSELVNIAETSEPLRTKEIR